jgi:hypothetical protein
MPRVLKDIRIQEVSSVDRGAGQGVRVMLMKREDDLSKAESNMTDAEIQALVAKAAGEAVAQALVAVQKANADELAKRDAEIVLLKMSDTEKAYMAGCKDDSAKKAFAGMSPEDRAAHMKKNPLKKADDVDPELAKRDVEIEKAHETIADLKKRLDAADHKENVQAFAKRAKDLGLQESDGEIMRKAYSGDVQAQATLDGKIAELTKSLDAAHKAGAIFTEFGSRIAKGGTSALDQLNAKAEEVRKAAPLTTPITKEQAFTKVYSDPANKELVDAYKRETGSPAAVAA